MTRMTSLMILRWPKIRVALQRQSRYTINIKIVAYKRFRKLKFNILKKDVLNGNTANWVAETSYLKSRIINKKKNCVLFGFPLKRRSVHLVSFAWFLVFKIKLYPRSQKFAFCVQRLPNSCIVGHLFELCPRGLFRFHKTGSVTHCGGLRWLYRYDARGLLFFFLNLVNKQISFCFELGCRFPRPRDVY